MADSQAVIVGGGGVAALPAFNVTDEAQGRSVFITQDDPASIGSAHFGQDPATGMTWINGGLTNAQIAASARGPVTIGLGLVNLNLIAAASRPVIIGQGAGISNLIGDAVVIGLNARGGGNSVVIGQGSSVTALAGTSRNVAINSAPTHATATGMIAINTSGSTILSQSGTFIAASNPVNTGGGIGIGSGGGPDVSAFGICIGTGIPTVTGNRGIAIGDNARAGQPTTATDAQRCIAIGTNAVAQGAGNGNVGSIALGDQARATGSTTQCAVAIGTDAIAAAGECRIGSATRPLEMFLATGSTLHLDEAGADPVMGVGTLDAAGTVTIATTAVTATSRIFVTYTSAATGVLFIGAIVVGTSFVVTSAAGAVDAGDTFNWMIVKP